MKPNDAENLDSINNLKKPKSNKINLLVFFTFIFLVILAAGAAAIYFMRNSNDDKNIFAIPLSDEQILESETRNVRYAKILRIENNIIVFEENGTTTYLPTSSNFALVCLSGEISEEIGMDFEKIESVDFINPTEVVDFVDINNFVFILTHMNVGDNVVFANSVVTSRCE